MDRRYELMSITKGAVGLAFAESGLAWDTEALALPGSMKKFRLAPGMPDDCISVQDALNHATGVEDDMSFDWHTFYMDYVKRDPHVLNYCKRVFWDGVVGAGNPPKTVKGYAARKTFKYNNVVWRILVEHFEAAVGPLTHHVGVEGQGVEWDTDATSTPLGLRGLRLSLESLGEYAQWARGILTKHWAGKNAELADRASIVPSTHWAHTTAGDADAVKVYCWNGWFLVTPRKNPQQSLVAFSPGYRAQYVCVDVSPGIMSPATQVQDNPDDEPTDMEAVFVRAYIDAAFGMSRLQS